MNNDLISRSALLAQMRTHGNRVPVDSGCREWETIFSPGVQLCIHDAEHAPAVDAEPVRHGRWVLNKHYGDYECSECGAGDFTALDFKRHNMNCCPNCYARMDGDNDAAD